MIQAVEYIFSQMAATYGAAWERSLGQAPITDTKTVWLSAVSTFKNSKKRIMWALQNLPERCPNSIEFKNLCYAAPMPADLELPMPPQDPAIMAMVVKGMKPRPEENPHGAREWAYRLKDRHQAGERLHSCQIACYQAALGAQ